MKLFKRVASAALVAVLALSSLATIGWTGVAQAAAGSDNCTWIGATGANLSTASNWSNCSSGAPVNGDSITLPADSNYMNIVNDVAGISLAGITVTGSTGGAKISGSAFTLTGNMSLSANLLMYANMTVGANLTVSGNGSLLAYDTSSLVIVSSPYNLTLNTELFGKVQGSGSVTVANGANLKMNANASNQFSGNLNVPDGSSLYLCGFNGATLPAALTIGGSGNSTGALATFGNCGMSSQTTTVDPKASVVLSGPVVLTADTEVAGTGDVKITGALSGAYTISMGAGQVGTLTIESSSNTSNTPNGSQASTTVTTNYSSNAPNQDITVGTNNIAVINGTYRDVYADGGLIKGNGTVNSLTAQTGATVSPGQSPGTLTILNNLLLAEGSVYQAEILNKDNYDQLRVGQDYTGTSPAVSIDKSTLNVQLLDGYKIAAGDKFTIIDNRSKTAVEGTFNNLPEGATFKVGTGIFKISYVGGDGNDVVLTAMASPGFPDTGFANLSASPMTTLLGTLVVAAGLVGVATKLRRQSARR